MSDIKFKDVKIDQRFYDYEGDDEYMKIAPDEEGWNALYIWPPLTPPRPDIRARFDPDDIVTISKDGKGGGK